MRILITGIAGFIGFHLASRLHSMGIDVIGIDAFTDYYDVNLKRARAAILSRQGIEIIESRLEHLSHTTLARFECTHVIHLAAQAGVRYSLQAPFSYIDANITAFVHLLEFLKTTPTTRLIYASSSSVYGLSTAIPFTETDPCNTPQIYMQPQKRSNELLAHSYFHLYGISSIGLRFFTVYGPWGRPDMAIYSFTKKAFANEAIALFNFGAMERDFTYIDDIIDGIISTISHPTGFEIYNLGNNTPVSLEHLVCCIEYATGCSIQRNLLPMQAGDIVRTMANIDKAKAHLGYSPKVSLRDGVCKFVAWYKEYAHELSSATASAVYIS